MSSDVPMIGVVSSVSPSFRKTGEERIFRPGPYYCTMAYHVAKQNARFILFSPQAVNWLSQTVDAWVPQNMEKPYGNWRKQKMPLPDSIYENVFVHLAIQGYAATLRKMAQKHQIPVFNPALPGKWLMAKWLSKSSLARYQPETLLLPEPKIALSHIRNWGMVYVKPVGGYGGTGVACIEQMPRGVFRISIDRPGPNARKVRMVLSGANLESWLAKRQKLPHLLQRGLNLCKIDQRKVDFRVVTHRDRTGQWNLVGIIPKMAARDGVVTNIIAGGEIVQLAELETLADANGWKIPVSQISTCAMEISKLISSRTPNTGILGFDIGVEENNRVSMIEMNPKPARSLLTKEMKNESARFASEFSLYLARK